MKNKFSPEESHDAELIQKSALTNLKEMGVAISGGTVIPNTEVALRVLETDPLFKDHIWFDEFHQKYFTISIDDNLGKIIREWDDEDNINLSIYMQRNLLISRMSDDTVYKAIRVYAKKNIRNEPKDWMNKLVWDKTPRIENFLINCAGSKDNEYIRAVSKNFWLSIAARVFSPGCKVDTMPILEGGQGKFKSTLLNIIGGKLHCEASHDIYNKDFLQGMHGKLIIEFADLSSFTKAEVNLIKDILVRKSDYIRLPYARVHKDFPRQSVFAGTTNKTTYLKDETGARRFWPVQIGIVDIQRAKDEREQLFAEAVFLFKQNLEWWHMPQGTEEEQELRREIDPWEPIIYEYITQSFETTTREIMLNCLHISESQQNRSEEIRIGNILRLLKWERVQKRVGNSRQYVYTPPIPSIQDLPDQAHINWED